MFDITESVIQTEQSELIPDFFNTLICLEQFTIYKLYALLKRDLTFTFSKNLFLEEFIVKQTLQI